MELELNLLTCKGNTMIIYYLIGLLWGSQKNLEQSLVIVGGQIHDSYEQKGLPKGVTGAVCTIFDWWGNPFCPKSAVETLVRYAYSQMYGMVERFF